MMHSKTEEKDDKRLLELSFLVKIKLKDRVLKSIRELSTVYK